jgi:hypothetical protein
MEQPVHNRWKGQYIRDGRASTYRMEGPVHKGWKGQYIRDGRAST